MCMILDDDRFDDMGGHTGSVRVNGAFPTVVCSGSHVVENVWARSEERRVGKEC